MKCQAHLCFAIKKDGFNKIAEIGSHRSKKGGKECREDKIGCKNSCQDHRGIKNSHTLGLRWENLTKLSHLSGHHTEDLTPRAP